MALEPLSLRAYAQRRKSLGLPGGSLPAVRKAIVTGRLVEAVVIVAGVKKIGDPELADREWVANTDPGKQGRDPDDTDGGGDESPLGLALAREKHWKAEMAELQFRQKAGELVESADVQAQFVDLCTTVRNKLLGLPSRMKQAHPDLTLDELATLDTYVRESLEELAAEPVVEATS